MHWCDIHIRFTDAPGYILRLKVVVLNFECKLNNKQLTYVLFHILFSLTFGWWSICNPWELDWCWYDISENDVSDKLLRLQNEVIIYPVYTGLLHEHSVLLYSWGQCTHMFLTHWCIPIWLRTLKLEWLNVD